MLLNDAKKSFASKVVVIIMEGGGDDDDDDDGNCGRYCTVLTPGQPDKKELTQRTKRVR